MNRFRRMKTFQSELMVKYRQTLVKILNLSGRTWSLAPNGRGCSYPVCLSWDARGCLHILSGAVEPDIKSENGVSDMANTDSIRRDEDGATLVCNNMRVVLTAFDVNDLGIDLSMKIKVPWLVGYMLDYLKFDKKYALVSDDLPPGAWRLDDLSSLNSVFNTCVVELDLIPADLSAVGVVQQQLEHRIVNNDSPSIEGSDKQDLNPLDWYAANLVPRDQSILNYIDNVPMRIQAGEELLVRASVNQKVAPVSLTVCSALNIFHVGNNEFRILAADWIQTTPEFVPAGLPRGLIPDNENSVYVRADFLIATPDNISAETMLQLMYGRGDRELHFAYSIYFNCLANRSPEPILAKKRMKISRVKPTVREVTVKRPTGDYSAENYFLVNMCGVMI